MENTLQEKKKRKQARGTRHTVQKCSESEGPAPWRAGAESTHGFPPGMPVRFGGMAGTRM